MYEGRAKERRGRLLERIQWLASVTVHVAVHLNYSFVEPTMD